MNLSIQKRLAMMILIILIFVGIAAFGTFQISKGAKFHELNILHLKYTLELSKLLTEFPIDTRQGEEVRVEALETIVGSIRAQPVDCLALITPFDEVVMNLIATHRAIDLCRDDLEDANQALSSLELYSRGELSRVDLYHSLLAARNQFFQHSQEFQQPIRETVDFTVLSTTLIVTLMALLMVGAVIGISRGISRTVATREQILGKLAESEAQNRKLARYDDLTKLPNRNLFMERLEYSITDAKRNNKKFALLFIDLDRFKSVNDTLGHVYGDELLKVAAQRLTSILRKTDMVARLGGDEFTVILPDQFLLPHLGNIAENILELLEKPFEIEGVETFISGSVGITVFPDDAQTSIDLIKNADVAMYRAKESGKNNFEFYSVELDVLARRRLEIEQDLRKSMSKGELCLHYQPIVHLGDMQTIGAETLLRWYHPKRGMVSPIEFIPVAEEIGLIVPMGEWVLNSACDQLKIWNRAGHRDFKLTVNVSVRQICTGDFADVVRRAIQRTGIRADCLCLEITESLFVDIKQQCLDTLHELNAIGVNLLLDDFGTGYSSFSYLHTLPFNLLKVDRSFVQEISKDGDAKEIASSIIHMAHTLKMQVTAEGVETAHELRYLNERSCDYAQGFLFDQALPAEQFNCGKTYREFIAPSEVTA
ncbi:MAG: putative bifunctional diguanylate cyclase/phosphodiesterase [Halioglobus sp.]